MSTRCPTGRTLASTTGCVARPLARAITALVVLMLVVLVLAPRPGGCQAPEGWSLVDRIVAVVDHEPVLHSDLERVLALGLDGPPIEGETARARRARVVRQLIDQRLRLREVERFTDRAVPSAAVEAQWQQLRARTGDPEAWQQTLDAVGLDEAGVRHVLRQQLRVVRYIDERLGPRVFVSPEAIAAYHRNTLEPAMTESGETVPPLDEVRDAIHAVLFEQGLNREVEAWTERLRARATIIERLDATLEALPPIHDVIE